MQQNQIVVKQRWEQHFQTALQNIKNIPQRQRCQEGIL